MKKRPIAALRRLAVLLSTLLLALLALLVMESPARADDLTVDLYTVGAGSYLYSAHGHTALCVTGGPHPEGRCYDYGIANVEGDLNMFWRSLRGEPIFVVVGVDQKVLVAAFGAEERIIEKQRLPLSQAEAHALYEAVESDVNNKVAYAYHPSTANCTTKVRDVIDRVMGGKLHEIGPAKNVPRFREILESGYRGKMLTLAVIALFSGTTIERTPTPWEHMFFPARLRDAVEERFGVKPERVYGREGIDLALTTLGGRVLLVLVGAVLAALIFRARRDDDKLRRELRFAAFILGLLGLFVYGFAIIFVYPELSHNWVMSVLWPTDLGLRWLSGVWLRRYVTVRLGAVALFGLLSLAGVIVQPIASVALMAALPFAAALFALRERAPAPSPDIAKVVSG
ncbi:MAG: DUF4105 domain-containing protein [Byssovorax sp.]